MGWPGQVPAGIGRRCLLSEPIDQAGFWDERAEEWAQHADGWEEFAGQFGRPAIDVLDPSPG